MTSDADASVLDAAWGHIAPTRETALGLGSFTRRRIERTIGLAAGLGSLVLGAQAFVASLGSTEATPGWHLALMIATFVGAGRPTSTYLTLTRVMFSLAVE